jgi:adenosylmethionine-8-amino-7-oxononanoate aminotransferase
MTAELKSTPVAAVPGNAAWIARSRAAVWHPCTQMKRHETWPMVPIARGRGAWLYDFDGRRYLDAVSSWWVNLFGHAHPKINAAIASQLDDLEHVMLAGFTQRPVVELSERLASIAPGDLGHCFYGSDGASAVEIALKMSFHYWRNRGESGKTGFIALANGYHGETLGALSVTDIALFRDAYAPLLRQHAVLPSPDARLARSGTTGEQHALAAAAALEEHLAMHHRTIAALVVEPLVQGAAGMAIYDTAYLARARAVHALRRSPDHGRDHDRLRTDRHDVRLRAGRHRAGLPLPVEGIDRRLPSVVGRADDG